MNKPGNSMDKFGVSSIGSYMDGDRYAVFDVEDTIYNMGLINYKDNNEGIYKVIWPYVVFGEKLDKRTPRKLHYGKKRENSNFKISSCLFLYKRLL
jgi:hypothetical protein